MSRRVNIVLPDATVKILDRIAPRGDRSRFISQAVLHYVQTRSAANLRERLKQGALANTKLDLEIAEEWFAVEQELMAETRSGRTGRHAFPRRGEIYLTALDSASG
jgi:CopG family transcriptional regulator/antitoxin EndoAI